MRLGSGVVLLLLFVRSGVDSTWQDHVVEQFMFFVGVMLAGVAIEEQVLNTYVESSGGDEAR